MKSTRTLIAVAAIAALVAAAVAAPATALAHARWKSSTPGKGEILQISPSQVVIHFSEDVQKVAGTYGITVSKDRGPDVTAGPSMLSDSDRSVMSVPLQPDLPPGRYVVNYKNVSDADGDANAGAFSFYIQTQPTAVDLANDAQLAKLDPTGPQETPGAGTTAGATTPGAGQSPAATVPATGAATAVGTANASSTTDNGGSNTGRNIAIAGAIVVALAVAAGAGWFAFLRPRR